MRKRERYEIDWVMRETMSTLTVDITGILEDMGEENGSQPE